MRGLICVLLAVAVLVGCVSRGEVKSFIPPVNITVVEPLKGVEKSFVGLFIPAVSTTLAFKSGGDIDSIGVNSGESVNKGEFIASISNQTYLADVAAAKARYMLAKANRERYQKLLKLNAVSVQQAQSAEANYVSAKTYYENSVVALDESELFAPFSGVVEERYVDTYQRVGAAQQIVKIINPDSLEVEFTIAPSDLPLLTHATVEYFVESETVPQRTFQAKLSRYVGVISQSEGYRVFVDIASKEFNPLQMGIRAGSSCNVVMRVASPYDLGYFSLPLTAIYNGVDGKNHIWVVDDSSRVMLKEVELGELLGNNQVVIKGGVEMGSHVVVAGIYHLEQGEKVRIASNSSLK